MAKTRATSKAAGKPIKMKKIDAIKTPQVAKKSSTELVNNSPKTRAAKRSLIQTETPFAPMKRLLERPPKLKADKIKYPDAPASLESKSEEDEVARDHGGKTKKEKSVKVKRVPIKKNK